MFFLEKSRVHRRKPSKPSAWITNLQICLFIIVASTVYSMSMASGGDGHHDKQQQTEDTEGHPIHGTAVKVFIEKGRGAAENIVLPRSLAENSRQTIVAAFTTMVQARQKYPRFDEALQNNLLQKVVIEPKVFNRFLKEFLFLVARTKAQKEVILLVNASMLEQQGYVNYPEKLIPRLEREFQWVLSKAATSSKPRRVSVQRDLKTAPIKTVKEIKEMSGKQREQALQGIFQTYLTTVDDYQSLMNQPYYDMGSTELMKPSHPDSTVKLYDIRIREALQIIIRKPYFYEHTPKAVRNVLNGRIWNVAFVKIDSRDWATRTRVAPKDKSVVVGKKETSIQPAKILINYHRKAEPEDPYYSETKNLPMGALSANQLARVIALEIEKNITDKSMRGHVAQDEQTALE